MFGKKSLKHEFNLSQICFVISYTCRTLLIWMSTARYVTIFFLISFSSLFGSLRIYAKLGQWRPIVTSIMSLSSLFNGYRLIQHTPLWLEGEIQSNRKSSIVKRVTWAKQIKTKYPIKTLRKRYWPCSKNMFPFLFLCRVYRCKKAWWFRFWKFVQMLFQQSLGR